MYNLNKHFVGCISIQSVFLLSILFTLTFQQISFARSETLSLDKPLVIRWKSYNQNFSLFTKDEKVFSIEENGNLALISQTDGKIIWRHNPGVELSTKPIFDGAVIFTLSTVSNDSTSTVTTIRAISTETGTTLWKSDLTDAVTDIYSNAEIPYLLLLLKNSSLITINKKTGETVTSTSIPENSSKTKIINENLIIYFRDKTLMAYQPSSKQTIWRSDFQADVSIAPIIQNSTLFLVTKSDHVTAINLLTGKTLWNKKVAKNIQSVFSANNSLLVATTENYIHSLSPQGKHRWKKLLDGRPSDNFLVFRDSLLMFTVGSNYGTILDIKKGKPLNRIPLGEEEYVIAPPVATSKYLLIQTKKGLTAYSNE